MHCTWLWSTHIWVSALTFHEVTKYGRGTLHYLHSHLHDRLWHITIVSVNWNTTCFFALALVTSCFQVVCPSVRPIFSAATSQGRLREFFKYVSNIHLDSRMTWLDSGGGLTGHYRYDQGLHTPEIVSLNSFTVYISTYSIQSFPQNKLVVRAGSRTQRSLSLPKESEGQVHRHQVSSLLCHYEKCTNVLVHYEAVTGQVRIWRAAPV